MPGNRQRALEALVDGDALLGQFIGGARPLPVVVKEEPVQGNAPKPITKASDDYLRLFQDSGYLPSYTASHSGAWNKGIWRDQGGKWNFPQLAAMSGGLGESVPLAGTAITQKFNNRMTVEGPLAESLELFQKKWKLTDQQVVRIHNDMGGIHRQWSPKEKFRLLSDGTLMPNFLNSDWLDSGKAMAMLENSGASRQSQLQILGQLGNIQQTIAETKLEAYNAAASATNVMMAGSSLVGWARRALSGRDDLPSPHEWAARNGVVTSSISDAEFVLRYEKGIGSRSIVEKYLHGFAADLIQGNLKVTSSLGGLAGLCGWDAAGEWGAMNQRLSGQIGQGQFDTGLTGKALEEALSIAVQIFLTRGMGSLAGRVAAGEAAR